MRDLLFKDLTSSEKKRRIISSSEIVDKQGVRSIIRRHFIYIVRDITGADAQKPAHHIYIVKKRDSKERIENFFCRIKGSIIIENAERQLLIIYVHSLKINLLAIPEHLVKYSEEIG